MGKPYSLDLRHRICGYIAAGNSCRAAGRVFGVSAATAVRYGADQRERGAVAPKPQGRPSGRFGKLVSQAGFLIEIVEAEPDITLQELSNALKDTHGITVSFPQSTGLWNVPGSHIKKGLIAQERDRPALRQARREWITRRQPRMRQEPHRLVFIDETAVKTNLTRLRGRSLKGERLYGTAPFGKWGTQTFIAGLTQNALIAPWVITGAMDLSLIHI